MSRRFVPPLAVRCIVGFVLLFVALTVPRAAGANDRQILGPSVSAPSVQTQGKRVRIKVVAGAAEPIAVKARGRIKQGGRSLPLRRSAASVAGGRSASIRLRPRRRLHQRRILHALRKGRTLKATVTVTLGDLAGNAVKRVLKIAVT